MSDQTRQKKKRGRSDEEEDLSSPKAVRLTSVEETNGTSDTSNTNDYYNYDPNYYQSYSTDGSNLSYEEIALAWQQYYQNNPQYYEQYNAQYANTQSYPQYPQFVDPKKQRLARRTLYRKAGDETWDDPTLAEWPENDWRIFVGNLGNDVTDEILKAAFSKYKSLQRVRVVRDKYEKTRGFGFVSLSDSKDFVAALREMNGKYIGNRPCKVQKSSWKDRNDYERMKIKRKPKSK